MDSGRAGRDDLANEVKTAVPVPAQHPLPARVINAATAMGVAVELDDEPGRTQAEVVEP